MSVLRMHSAQLCQCCACTVPNYVSAAHAQCPTMSVLRMRNVQCVISVICKHEQCPTMSVLRMHCTESNFSYIVTALRSAQLCQCCAGTVPNNPCIFKCTMLQRPHNHYVNITCLERRQHRRTWGPHTAATPFVGFHPVTRIYVLNFRCLRLAVCYQPLR
jgi:hypothetical protein